MFESLGDKFESVFKKLRGQGKITESNIQDAMREVRLALLEADVNFKVVKKFTEDVTQKAMGQEVLLSVSPGQQIIKIVHDELIEMMGGVTAKFDLPKTKTNIILLLGLQGSGKTTFAGKLAKKLLSQGKNPLLVACDIHRPAAMDQLKVVADQIGVPVFIDRDDKIASRIALRAVEYAKQQGRDVVIIDTAGRLQIDEVKMDELTDIKTRTSPTYTFLVADAMTGQEAVNIAGVFNDKVGIDGVCLTKLDGDARGGAALSIKSVTGKPIVFAGVGEKVTDLEQFHPDRMASRILGMGDVISLVEKAQDTFDAEQAMKMQEKMRKATFNLQDFLDQMQQIKKMGSITDVLGMIPGMGKQIKDVKFGDKDMARMEAIILSMTPKERENPDVINGSRRKRIAAGSGNTVNEVNKLLKQFVQTKKMMKMMSGKGMFGKKFMPF